jgi:maltooligosyltrehalose synthase
MRRFGRVGQPPIAGFWADTRVDLRAGQPLTEALGGRRHLTTGQGLALADVLRDFPIALLATPDEQQLAG